MLHFKSCNSRGFIETRYPPIINPKNSPVANFAIIISNASAYSRKLIKFSEFEAAVFVPPQAPLSFKRPPVLLSAGKISFAQQIVTILQGRRKRSNRYPQMYEHRIYFHFAIGLPPEIAPDLLAQFQWLLQPMVESQMSLGHHGSRGF